MENIFTSFIVGIGKRLLGGGEVLPKAVVTNQDEEIPRYPPFMKGLPAAPVNRILSTQTELIKSIEQALALPDDLYQAIALPVIGRYAAYSHLLPASESHHHRGAGGLFRHGLEVAHWATLASQGCLFATQATPKERKALEPRWRLAVCFAGLLHDIGKPVSDMAVVDQLGHHTWNPCDENLTDWAEQNKIDRYFLRWRENRHKRHEQFSALVIERVLTRKSRTYILEPGPDIMQAMLETIHGLDRGAKLYELVIEADRKSVERDLKAHYHGLDSAMGMPVEKYLFDAMRRLIKSGQWTANESGARVWRFQEGLHIVWRLAVKEILGMLDKDHIPGIPRDEDTLADILIERGLAIPKISKGGQYRYWRMQPGGMNGSLFMLRLASTELIYSGEPPVVVIGQEVLDGEDVQEPAKTKKVGKKRESLPEPVVPAIVEIEAAAVEPMDDDYLNSENFDDGYPAYFDSDINLDQKVQSEADNRLPVPEQTLSAVQFQSETEVAKTPIQDESTPSNTVIHLDADQPFEAVNSITAARRWLENQGLAGEWLIKLAEAINSGCWHLEMDFLDAQNKLLLPFPGTAQQLQLESNLFIKTLDEKGWLLTDVLSPMRKVQVINGIRGVQLASEPSVKLKQLLTAVKPKAVRSDDQPETVQPAKQGKSKPKILPEIVEKNALPERQSQLELPDTMSEMPMQNQEIDKNPDETATNDALTKIAEQPAKTAKPSSIPSKSKPDSDKLKKSLSRKEKKTQLIQLHGLAIKTWITEIEQSSSQSPVSDSDEGWFKIDDQEIERLLQKTPGLSRIDLMLMLGAQPNLRSVSNGLQMQRKT
ncbi:MobH family relaxase [Methylomonas sp. AM2-LC]|uniref:MobH family relaxase n=1 Tax=Methylomonas sp. AM2-LC TaxID=3153301 RepID=UPI0032633507